VPIVSRCLRAHTFSPLLSPAPASSPQLPPPLPDFRPEEEKGTRVTEALPSPRGMERNVQQLTCQSSRPCPCQHSPSQRPSRWCQPPSQRRPGSVSPTPSAIPSIPQPVLVASQQAPAQASGQPAPSDTAKSRTGLCGPELIRGTAPHPNSPSDPGASRSIRRRPLTGPPASVNPRELNEEQLGEWTISRSVTARCGSTNKLTWPRLGHTPGGATFEYQRATVLL